MDAENSHIDFNSDRAVSESIRTVSGDDSAADDEPMLSQSSLFSAVSGFEVDK